MDTTKVKVDNLSSEKLKEIKALEQKLGVILIAYQKDAYSL